MSQEANMQTTHKHTHSEELGALQLDFLVLVSDAAQMASQSAVVQPGVRGSAEHEHEQPVRSGGHGGWKEPPTFLRKMAVAVEAVGFSKLGPLAHVQDDILDCFRLVVEATRSLWARRLPMATSSTCA